VPLAAPRLIYDLGCGPSNSTALLAVAYPEAEIIGVDNSPAMLTEARKALPKLIFERADLAEWMPPRLPDLLFSNAAMQWVPDHSAVLQRLLVRLETGGVLAVQIPDNLDEPSHQLMRAVANEGSWRQQLASAVASRNPLPSPHFYYDLLKPDAARVDIWQTAYNHPLRGAKAIVDWVRATGLRPYLDCLDDNGRRRFLEIYEARIAKAYPAGRDGLSLLRFPRLFIVAVR
jgi:trans-aconitate 2-methyltransferase